jgi:hypothetical protein
MFDERAGSRLTFLNSKLRNRTDVKTMLEQMSVRQWYSYVRIYIAYTAFT